jgi:hypothetical protein
MKFNVIGFGLVLGLISSSSFATEYIYRDLMANTLPAQHCDAKEKASAEAQKSYKLSIYSKKFCQTQGYGWHVEKVKEEGKLVCNECSTSGQGDEKDKYQCHIEDVVVECKRIKPGSVGMLPGKS